MTSLNLFILLVGELFFLGTLTLILHQLSSRYGLNPLVFLLGSMTAALQFRALGSYPVAIGGVEMNLTIGSYVLLPTLLMGLLIIYIVNGSLQTRNVFAGLLLVTLIIATYQSLTVIFSQLSLNIEPPTGQSNLPPRIPLASAVTLGVDMIVLVVVYQTASNWFGRYPSRLATGMALLAAIWSDGIIFPFLAYFGKADLPGLLTLNMVGKSLAAIILWGIALVYLAKFSSQYPRSAASTQRPPLDIFNSQLQLEQRASLHYSLLRTTHLIGQLIVRSSDPVELLQQTCELLTNRRDYALVWIELRHKDPSETQPAAKAGSEIEFLNKVGAFSDRDSGFSGPSGMSFKVKKAAIQRMDQKSHQTTSWGQTANDYGLKVFAAFPMRNADQVMGVLSVGSKQITAFEDEEESNLLQQLADDLAYALIGLDARQRQGFLTAGMETMRDGLLITDRAGGIIYANPAIIEMLHAGQNEIPGQNLYSFMSVQQADKIARTLLPRLRLERQISVETELQNGEKSHFSADLMIAQVNNAKNEPENLIVNIRDITRRRIFERRLLALNKFSTELVQIRDPATLFNMILSSCEELLQADACAISLGRPQDDEPTEIHVHNMPEAIHLAVVQGIGKYSQVVSELYPASIFVKEIANEPFDPTLKRRVQAQGFQAFMLLPVYYQGNPMGVLGLYYRDPQDFDETIHQVGYTAAQTLAIALQNAHLYQSEHSQRQYAEAIVQATKALNSSLNLDLVLNRILEQTWRVVPCDAVNLMLIEGDQACMVRQLFRSASGEIESVHNGPTLPLSTPTLQRMLTTGQPILIEDTQTNTNWRALERSYWIRSYAAAPLQIREQIIGFLNVNSREPAFFNDESLHRLQVFASHAAAALHNARIYEGLQNYSLELEDRVKERTAELSRSRDRIVAILESAPDAVFVLDSQKNLLQSNQAGALLYHQTEDGKSVLFGQELMSRLKTGQLPDEQAIVDVNGRIYQALSSPLQLTDEEAGMVVVFRDVTRFQELNRMKTQFVSDVSHELRTPLANLSIFLDLLASEQNIAKRDKYQATLRRETNRLTELIEDLLTISRLESNRIQFSIKDVEIVSLIRNLVEDRLPIARQHNLELTTDSLPDEVFALVDPRLLTQVLSNILTNALNYTPAGGKIRLMASEHQDAETTWVTISISDNGYGISTEELPNIFDRFYRGAAGRNTSLPGTGLGLAISQEIIKRMGGKITVESESGAGSVFTIWMKKVL